MRKLFITLALGGLLTTGSFAQQQTQNRGQRIENFRVAYISQHLNLTSEESQRFWPVYNAYRADRRKLRQNYMQESNGGKLTAQQQISFDQSKLDLKKKYTPQLIEAIGQDKLNQLIVVEDNFKRELIKMLGNRQ